MNKDVKQAWIQRVLGIDVLEVGTPEESDALSHVELVERLQFISADARSNNALEALKDPLKAAALAVQTHAPNAIDLLDALEQRVAALAHTKRMADVSATAKGATVSAKASLVSLAKLRLRLRSARSGYEDAVSNLELSCQALLKSETFAADPRSKDPEFLNNVATVGDRVPDIADVADGIEEALDDMTNAADATTRQALAEKAVAKIDAYRAQLDDPILTVMENTPAGSFPIFSTLSGVLDELTEALRA